MVFGVLLVLFVVVDAAMAATDFCIAKSCKGHEKNAPKVQLSKDILVWKQDSLFFAKTVDGKHPVSTFFFHARQRFGEEIGRFAAVLVAPERRLFAGSVARLFVREVARSWFKKS